MFCAMKRQPDEAQARWAEVVSTSKRLQRFHIYLPIVAEGLGRKDADLIKRERDYVATRDDSELWTLANLLLDSNMYVMSAYELVRQIDWRIWNESQHADLQEGAGARIKECKRRLERVRIPLAKFQPPSKNPDDYGFAYPKLLDTGVIAWQVAPHTIVSRRELADAFMDALRALPG
jgi:hypothetical protein